MEGSGNTISQELNGDLWKNSFNREMIRALGSSMCSCSCLHLTSSHCQMLHFHCLPVPAPTNSSTSYNLFPTHPQISEQKGPLLKITVFSKWPNHVALSSVAVSWVSAATVSIALSSRLPPLPWAPWQIAETERGSLSGSDKRKNEAGRWTLGNPDRCPGFLQLQLDASMCRYLKWAPFLLPEKGSTSRPSYFWKWYHDSIIELQTISMFPPSSPSNFSSSLCTSHLPRLAISLLMHEIKTFTTSHMDNGSCLLMAFSASWFSTL